MNDIEKLADMIEECNNIVFFGGAGVSTESGIPDFRSVDGLYGQKYKFPPEEIVSRSFYERNTEEFFEFYKDRMIFKEAEPNKAHEFLALLEKEGKLSTIITQNIDSLHTMAGSKNVLELHGSVMRNYCVKCNKFYDVDYVLKSQGIPVCGCGGIVKPDVVLYEEPLNDNVVTGAINAIHRADMLIIGGTSLIVYPAAGLINYFKGKYLVLINKSTTNADYKADLVIHEPIGEVFGSLWEDLYGKI